MTFTEAALEVLRSAGEPLHYKKITELAIAGNLLSHVGKSPEVTMSSRLATLVKKDRGQSQIIKVRPGVFALREAAMQTDKEANTEAPSSEQSAPSETKTSSVPVERPPLPGADVFPQEADDDFPILAGLEEEAAGGVGGEERGRGRRRRRRRRGGKGGEPGMLDAPASTERREPLRNDREAGPPAEGPRNDRSELRHDRGEPRHDGGRREPRHDGARREPPRREDNYSQDLDFAREPGEGDLLGRDLADAAYQVLLRGDRMPATFPRIADLLVRRGRLSGSPEVLAPTVAAALRADAARAGRAHGRPRFRIAGQRVSLTEWLLPRDAVRSEEAAEHAAEAQRDQVRRAFAARLNEMPAAGFAELVATWLNAEGVTTLRAVRRPGSSGRELHFAGTLRRGAEESRLAFVVLRSGRDIDRETVVEARGSLHHYGAASSAWLVTTGRINPTAREEAAAEGAAACALIGGADLTRAMERLGIGLREHYVALSDIDFDLLEALGDTGAPRRDRDERSGRDRDRPRDRDRDQAYGQGREPRAAANGIAGREEGREPTAKDRPPFDLLDPDAAEASRLVLGPNTAWDERAAADAELETRPTMRVPPLLDLEDGDDEEGDAPLDVDEESVRPPAADAAADGDTEEPEGDD
ncbi:MAG: HTH domain-containing protein [Polyangiales bacterium]